MAVYMLSYDLRQPGRNYRDLYDELRRLDGVRVLESVWLVDVTQTAMQVRDAVETYLDRNDGVLVLEITQFADWAYSNLIGSSGLWLQRKRP
jgi:hypothetical protein